MPPRVIIEKCIKCGVCSEICPSDVFYGSDTKAFPNITYPEECWHCGACLIECPKNALYLEIPLAMRPHAVKVG
jgi:adenylylsulfate reductase subunit B